MPAKKSTASVKTARSAASKIVLNTVGAGSVVGTVHFGGVSVKADAPKEGELRRNIHIGQQALARAVPKLLKPGVAFKTFVSTPLFRADPEDPSRLIRELNGRVSTGVFVNGKFKVLSARR